MLRMPNARIVLAGAVALAAATALVIVVAAGSGDEGRSERPLRVQHATLTLERAQHPAGYEELVVSLPDERLNTPATTGGATSVLLTCVDRQDRVTIRRRHRWPLLVEAGYPPHVHQPASPEVLDGLGSCRLTGRGIDFAGRVTGRLPALEPAG